MGTYLSIGIITGCSVKRKDFPSSFKDEDINKCFEKYVAPLDLFDVTPMDDRVTYDLKESVIREDWVSYIRDFYRDYYQLDDEKNADDREFCMETIDVISKLTDTDEILEYGNEKRYYCYHDGEETIYEDCGCYHRTPFRTNTIGLTLEGKVSAESLGGFPTFLANLIRIKFKDHPLSKATILYIAG